MTYVKNLVAVGDSRNRYAPASIVLMGGVKLLANKNSVIKKRVRLDYF
jgi:hypothetical protein